jgi:hypothetical protein
MVRNPTAGLPIAVGSTTVSAICLFDAEDGTIAAWSPAVDPIAAGGRAATRIVDNSPKVAVSASPSISINEQGNFPD